MNSSNQRIAEVERYIHELAIALSGLPADEREDVISGIREHIEDALLAISEPTPADVRRILDDLGDPLAIAADAGAGAVQVGQTTAAAPAPEPAAPTWRRLLEQDWVPAAPLVAFGASAALLLTGFGPLASLTWLAAIALIVASPLWHGPEKLMATAVALAGLLVLAGYDAWALGGFGRYPGMYGILGMAAVLATGVILLRRAAPRAPGRAAGLAATPDAVNPVPVLERAWIPAAMVLSFTGSVLLFLASAAGLTPVVALGWLAGLVILAASPLWRPIDLVIGAPVLIGGPAVLLLTSPWTAYEPFGVHGIVNRWYSLSWPGPAGWPWLLAGLVGTAVVAVLAWLYHRGARRVRTTSGNSSPTP